jgi:hypothetical protein
MRRHLLMLSSGLLLLAAACHKDAEKIEPPAVGEAFPTLLIPPNSAVVSRSGSRDALQITFRSTVTADAVAAYYRSQFSKAPWVIVSDLTDSTGAISMHVDWSETQQPMWLQIIPLGDGSQIEMAGAVPDRDSSYVQRSRAAEDSSNTVVPR